MTIKKPRNRAAQDATLINLRALKRRVDALEAQSEILTELSNLQSARILDLMEQMRRLAPAKF